MAGETRRYFGDRGGNGGNAGTGHPRGENGWGGQDRFTPEGKARALANLQPDRLAFRARCRPRRRVEKAAGGEA